MKTIKNFKNKSFFFDKSKKKNNVINKDNSSNSIDDDNNNNNNNNNSNIIDNNCQPNIVNNSSSINLNNINNSNSSNIFNLNNNSSFNSNSSLCSSSNSIESTSSLTSSNVNSNSSMGSLNSGSNSINKDLNNSKRNNNNSGSNSSSGSNEYIPIVQYSNIHNIDWDTIINIEKVDYGDMNIFLIVTFLGHSCEYNQILIKSSTSIVQEVYASILESILKLPIPEMRLLEFSDEEFNQMSKSLLNISKSNESLYDFIKLELSKSFFLIMEYTSYGKTFKELNHREYFSGSSGEKKLIQLGHIMAFDIFCNNWDRLPLIWDNGTNFSNILFYDIPNKNGWYFSLINSNITCINNSSFTIGYRKYITRLKSLLYSIFKNPMVESNQIKKMRENISKTYKINLSSSSGILLQRGILQGIQLIVNKITLTILKDTKEKLKHLIKIDFNNIWRKGIDSIYLPFLLDVLDNLINQSN